jgi:hypothetical protein
MRVDSMPFTKQVIGQRWREDFPLAVKRILAQRTGNHCSNPDCSALTSGPQRNPTRAVNVGVAAHICAASPEGPRYDEAAAREIRVGAENGIWLCQTCAKLIDNDVEAYSVKLLRLWKSNAEQEAAKSVGKTAPAALKRPTASKVESLKRDLKMRDNLQRDLLKPPQERCRDFPPKSRTSKFSHSEVIIRSIDDRSYPEVEETPAGHISGWFKLEVWDFYHGGLEFAINIHHAWVDNYSGEWSVLSPDESETKPPRGRF